ncbi:hypothetical protein ACTID9_23620 [Brevibacillus fluminis]
METAAQHNGGGMEAENRWADRERYELGEEADDLASFSLYR